MQEVKVCINEKRTIEIQNENWEYNYLMNRLKVYVDLAQWSEAIRENFRSFFDDMEKQKKTIDDNANSVITVSGAQPTVPSILVNQFGKKKHVPSCSICYKRGHYCFNWVFKKWLYKFDWFQWNGWNIVFDNCKFFLWIIHLFIDRFLYYFYSKNATG